MAQKVNTKTLPKNKGKQAEPKPRDFLSEFIEDIGSLGNSLGIFESEGAKEDNTESTEEVTDNADTTGKAESGGSNATAPSGININISGLFKPDNKRNPKPAPAQKARKATREQESDDDSESESEE